MTDRIEIIDLLAYHEEALSNLYDSFYKVHRTEIWKYLSSEEIKHAGWIRSIKDNVIEGSVNFETGSFSVENISASIDLIVEKKLDCEEGRVGMEDSFTIALQTESGMLEKTFLDAFWSDDVGIQNVLEGLKSETDLHRNMLKLEYENFLKKKKEIEDQEKPVYDTVNILGYHAEYERLLAKLYSVLEAFFPDEELWPYLVEEEKKHESWVKEIILKVVDGVILYESGEVLKEVKSEVVKLKNVINDLEKDITAEEAYKTAYEAENSMMEKDFFEKFSSDAPAVEKILKALVKDIEMHRSKIEEKIEE